MVVKPLKVARALKQSLTIVSSNSHCGGVPQPTHCPTAHGQCKGAWRHVWVLGTPGGWKAAGVGGRGVQNATSCEPSPQQAEVHTADDRDVEEAAGRGEERQLDNGTACAKS